MSFNERSSSRGFSVLGLASNIFKKKLDLRFEFSGKKKYFIL